MEGDTPSFLGLLPNGLNSPEHPEWGGWGGRYILADCSGNTGVYSDAVDWVIGKNNDTFLSKYASIWRWRQAFQFDFAARMEWSVNGDAAETNHHPVISINGSCGLAALEIPYNLNQSIVLDASQTSDPDNDALSFNWFHYREPTFRLEGDIARVSPNATFVSLNKYGSVVEVTPNVEANTVSHTSRLVLRKLWLIVNAQTLHIILSVEDAVELPLTAYKRIILTPQA